jgi:hypothetical protein
VGFTVGLVGAAFLYRVTPAPILVLASALVAAGGIAMATTATGLAQRAAHPNSYRWMSFLLETSMRRR